MIDLLKKYIQKFNYTQESPQYTKIINERNFDRLVEIIDPKKIFFGGNYDRDKRYIEPTILHQINWSDAAMQEEIFGPVLPVITYNHFNEALQMVADHEKPLAAYLFSTDADEKKRFTEKISFGGGCINDVVMHLSNVHLPFGGVGNSGIGHYHGKFGFDAFSHQKSVLSRANWGEPNLKYPPYTDKKLKWIKKFL